MTRCLTLVPHLTTGELEQRYRQSHDPVERSHWHMLWLLGCGHRIPAVATMTGYRAKWIRIIVHRYNAEGPAGLVDRRQQNRGRTGPCSSWMGPAGTPPARWRSPEGLHLVVLPPASPELQPVERVWPLVDEPVADQTSADRDELEAVLVNRCQTLRANRRTITAHTYHHWWPREGRPRTTL